MYAIKNLNSFYYIHHIVNRPLYSHEQKKRLSFKTVSLNETNDKYFTNALRVDFM